MLKTFNDDTDLFKKFITCDESWVYGYDTETKAQSSRFATMEDIQKIETGAFGDTKKRVWEVFRGLEKTLV